jgi:hypothetical protein
MKETPADPVPKRDGDIEVRWAMQYVHTGAISDLAESVTAKSFD